MPKQIKELANKDLKMNLAEKYNQQFVYTSLQFQLEIWQKGSNPENLKERILNLEGHRLVSLNRGSFSLKAYFKRKRLNPW